MAHDSRLWCSTTRRLMRQARALEDTSRNGTRVSYQNLLSRQRAIRRNARAGPVRLVVGFLRILLVVEKWPIHGWRVLDYFPLTSADDRDLLWVVAEMGTNGYPSHDSIKARLAPSVFSPRGAEDPESIAAMMRLGRRGMPVSNKIIAIADPSILSSADGRQFRRSRVER
jgi:hypothetical protein